MRAYRLSDNAIERTDLPEPQPGPGEVRIRVRACSLNYRDYLIMRGLYPAAKRGVIPLSDGAGEIDAVGDGVTGVESGDRVVATFFPGWLGGPFTPAGGASALGGLVDGMLAEYRVLPAAAVLKLPDHLSFEDGACLPCAAVTAWNCLTYGKPLQPGQVALLLGTGGVSLFGLQLAGLFGCETVITSSSDAKLARAKEELGAHHTINYKTTPNWPEAVVEATGGADRVVEIGGPGTFAQSMAASRVDGTISIVGNLGGIEDKISPMGFIGKRLTIHGVTVGSKADFATMLRAIAANKLRPVIDRGFDFADAPAAYSHMAGATHFGKIVIRVS